MQAAAYDPYAPPHLRLVPVSDPMAYVAPSPYAQVQPASPLVIEEPLTRKDKARRRFRKNMVMFCLGIVALVATLHFFLSLSAR